VSLLLSGVANAQAVSADTEIIRPSFSPRAPLGMSGMRLEESQTLRLGTYVQYANNPLVLEGIFSGESAVVANRATTQLGLSWDASKRVSVYGMLPIAAQWGSQSPQFAADGVGSGDLIGGVRLSWFQTDTVAFGSYSHLTLPTSRADAWLGERTPRLLAGLSTQLTANRTDILLDVGAIGRGGIDTTAALALRSELDAGLGLRQGLTEAISASTSIHAQKMFGQGLTPTTIDPVEVLAGLALEPVEGLVFDVGVGHGLTTGYGATDLRLFTGLIWTRPPPAEEELKAEIGDDLPVLAVQRVPEPVIPKVEVKKVEWKQGELARVHTTHIEIKDPIQFQVDADLILPVSMPILSQVADLLNTYPQILQLVIVGHASEEGSYTHNYSLSLNRAVSILERLVEAGVHPDRLSVRGMGEVQPVVEGSDEAALAKNRRVEFRVAKLRKGDEPQPVYPKIDQLPWTGGDLTIKEPPPPPPEPEKKPEPKDPDEFEFDEDDAPTDEEEAGQ